MKKRILSLALALVMCLGLTVSAGAYDMGKVGESNIVSMIGHTGFIDQNGSLWMWGRTDYGQLGNGTASLTPEAKPPVKVLDNVAAVSCGDLYTAAIKTDGSLWMWGYNGNGQLGNGTTTSSSPLPIQTVPVKVLDSVAAVSCGSNHTAAIKTDGSLWMWGRNSYGQLGNGGGGNATSQIASSSPLPIQTVPVKVLDSVTAVSCGYDFTAAIKTDGSLWMWGQNYGQLGNGTQDNSSTPVKVMDNVTAVSCGNSHTAAIKTDSSLWMWGDNDCGQLGNGTRDAFSTPVKVMDNVTAVSCGWNNTAAIKTDGTLWTWGIAPLGNGILESSSVPVKVLDNVAAVSNCSIAVKSDGTLWTWGLNGDSGTLGYEGGNVVEGNSHYQTVPKQVVGLTAKVPATADTPSNPETPKPETASPTNDKLTVNGQLQNPTVYKINGSNYFKIRDLAAILDGTGNQFDVGYDGALQSVTATTGKGYAKQPGDLAGAATGGSQTATPSNDTIYVNGQRINAEVYKIGGSNYFKLRDLGDALGFTVGWSAEQGVYIETN